MRFANAKSVLKANLEVQVSHRIHSSLGAVVLDGPVILWYLNWPKNCFLSHLAEAMYEYVEKISFVVMNIWCCLIDTIHLVLEDQLEREKKVSYQLQFTLSTPLPCREKALSCSTNKVQFFLV